VSVQRELAGLRQEHGGTHEIWIVPKAPGGGPTWYARRRGDPVGTELHADMPGALSISIKNSNADEATSAALDDLRKEHHGSGWRFGTIWATAAGPHVRRLTASRGAVLLTAKDAAEMRAKIHQEP
jgi:hypothetical protein